MSKKRKFNKKLKKSEMKLEKKLKPPPFYNESVHPAQILNQYHQNLLFNFAPTMVSLLIISQIVLRH
jgi:hypothetical protein